MHRFLKLFLATLGVAWASLVLPFLSPGARAAHPTELDELLRASAAGTDAGKVEALLDVLREAEQRHAEQRSTAEPGAAPESSGSSLAAEAGPAAVGDATALPGAVDGDAVDSEEDPSAKPEEPKRVIRAGCMYSGAKLIWEKVPGGCDH